jgi:hypothetical protein
MSARQLDNSVTFPVTRAMREEIDDAVAAEGISLAQFMRSAVASRLLYTKQITDAIAIERHPDWPKHRRVLNWHLRAMLRVISTIRGAVKEITVADEPGNTGEMVIDMLMSLDEIERRIRYCISVVKKEE